LVIPDVGQLPLSFHQILILIQALVIGRYQDIPIGIKTEGIKQMCTHEACLSGNSYSDHVLFDFTQIFVDSYADFRKNHINQHQSADSLMQISVKLIL